MYPRAKEGYKTHINPNGSGVESRGLRQQFFDSMYNAGIRHFAISNYTPSKPDLYPLSEHIDNTYDSISSPNAEHYGMAERPNEHWNGIGSMYNSSHSDITKGFNATGENRREAIEKIINAFQYPTGGLVTLNHPKMDATTWCGFPAFYSILDYFPDGSVGLEVLNGKHHFLEGMEGFSLDLWDTILSTGRTCWGTFGADQHSMWTETTMGVCRNVLLVDEKTELSALEAYRKGAFYGAMYGSGLIFNKIEVVNNTVYCDTNTSDSITFIYARAKMGESEGLRTTRMGNVAEFTFPKDTIYFRIEATDGEEYIYSQPITFLDKENLKKHHLRETAKKVIIMD